MSKYFEKCTRTISAEVTRIETLNHINGNDYTY